MAQDSLLLEKSLHFAARIVKLHRYLTKEKHEKGSRVCSFLPYETEAQFRAGFVSYLAKAKERILYYRQYRDTAVMREYAVRRTEKAGIIPDRTVWDQYLALPPSELSQQVNATREFWLRQPSMRNMQAK